MAKEEKKIMKSDWISNFTLIGKPVITDHTFKIDEKSEKSSWIYNSINLGVDCSEKHGVVYCEGMGGYSDERENVIYVHGKKEDGSDDFDNRFEVAWEDRFDEDILESVGNLCFFTVGLEKTDKGKTFYKEFLSMYDAIAYIQKHLTSDVVVNVKGSLKYSTYNEQTQIRKTINSIVLSSVDDPSKYKAEFTQSILLDKDSASLKNIDKDKSVMYVDARVLDYVKEYNGVEVKGQLPYPVQFEFEMPLDNQEKCKKIIEKVFRVKKGITQITFEGEFVEGGATVTATREDVPDEIWELVELGLYTEEDALKECSSNGNRERRMVLKRPIVRLAGEEKTPVYQKFEERYDEEDLVLDCMMAKDEGSDDAPWDENDAEESSGDSDMDWLNDL